ncbi:unnamed protein product [Orchesella dallaii]|uniref:Odorant receptor n=1 Tax=Orchesella dallaii TaxID=48710 RepID=A0ABP1PL97_9HEXA
MAFATGAINVKLLLQRFIFPPFPCHLVTISSQRFLSSEPYNNNRLAQRIWHGYRTTLILLLFLTCWQSIYLVSNWNQNPIIEKFGVLMFLMSYLILFLTHYVVIEKERDDLSFLYNEACKLVHLSVVPRQYTLSIKDVMSINSAELFAYAVPFVSIGLPAPVIFLPFICDYDPLQLFLEVILNVGFGTGRIGETISRFLATSLYIVVVLHVYVVAVDVLLMCIHFGYAVMKAAAELKMSSPASNPHFHLYTGRLLEYKEQLKQYKVLQLLTGFASRTSKECLAIMVAMGALLCASMAYFIFFLYDTLPAIMLYTCYLLLLLIFGVNFILCAIATRPNSDADKFRERWKRCLVSRMARLQLKSCPPVGFAIGFSIKIVKAKTPLSIADVFLNSMATMALLASAEH